MKTFTCLALILTLTDCIAQFKSRLAIEAGTGYSFHSVRTSSPPRTSFTDYYQYNAGTPIWAGISLENSSLSRFRMGTALKYSFFQQQTSTPGGQTPVRINFNYVSINPYGKILLLNRLSLQAGPQVRILLSHQTKYDNPGPFYVNKHAPCSLVIDLRAGLDYRLTKKLSVVAAYKHALSPYDQMRPLPEFKNRFYTRQASLALTYMLGDVPLEWDVISNLKQGTPKNPVQDEIDQLDHAYSSAVTSSFFYYKHRDPGFSLALNLAYDKSLPFTNHIVSLGALYNYTQVAGYGVHSVGPRALLHYIRRRLDVYAGGGISLRYGDRERISPRNRRYRPTYYVGAKYFFSKQYAVVVEGSTYRYRDEFFPTIGISRRFNWH